MHQHRAASALGLATVVVVALASSVAWACTPTANLSPFRPGSGAPGTPILVEGAQFRADVAVDIRWNGVDGELLGTAVGPRFSVTVRVPDGPPGFHTVHAVQRDADGTVAGHAREVFESAASARPATPVAADRPAAPPGTAADPAPAAIPSSPAPAPGASSASPAAGTSAAAPPALGTVATPAPEPAPAVVQRPGAARATPSPLVPAPAAPSHRPAPAATEAGAGQPGTDSAPLSRLTATDDVWAGFDSGAAATGRRSSPIEAPTDARNAADRNLGLGVALLTFGLVVLGASVAAVPLTRRRALSATRPAATKGGSK